MWLKNQGKSCRLILQKSTRDESKQIIFPSSWIIKAKLLLSFFHPCVFSQNKFNAIPIFHLDGYALQNRECLRSFIYLPQSISDQVSSWCDIYWKVLIEVITKINYPIITKYCFQKNQYSNKYTSYDMISKFKAFVKSNSDTFYLLESTKTEWLQIIIKYWNEVDTPY